MREAPHAFKPLLKEALWLSPLCFLLYVAAEMGTYLWAASLLVGNRGVSLPEAGIWVSVYFGSITIGRFSAGLIANRLGNRRLITLGIAMATTGATLFACVRPAPRGQPCGSGLDGAGLCTRLSVAHA